MKRTGSVKETSKSKGFSINGSARPSTIKLAVSLKSRGADLRRGRVYRLVPDRKAGAEGFVPIVDGSDEDYLYRSEFFNIINITYQQASILFPKPNR